VKKEGKMSYTIVMGVVEDVTACCEDAKRGNDEEKRRKLERKKLLGRRFWRWLIC